MKFLRWLDKLFFPEHCQICFDRGATRNVGGIQCCNRKECAREANESTVW
jgi:hypothetical protein